MRTDRYKEQPVKKSRKLLKVLLALIILLIIAIAAAVLYSYKTTMDSLMITFPEIAPAVEFRGEYLSMDYVVDSSGTVSAASEYLDTGSLGDKKMEFKVSKPMYGGLLVPSKKYTLSYTVTDTVAPIILWNGSGTNLKYGEDFDINNVLAYGDNADPDPSVTIDGKVNVKKTGSYKLHVTITDSSGNSTDCDTTVNVTKDIGIYSTSSEHTQFKAFKKKYNKDGRTFGIDVSAWQDEIDFKKVRASGCEFVMIRIGYTSDDGVAIDKRFENNFKNAKKAGLRVGIYLYSSDNTVEKARASAAKVVEMLGGEVLDLPVAFDWEDFGHFQTYGMTFTDLNDMYDAFSEEITAAGYDCMLYGSRNYLEKVWNKTKERPVWLAHYTDETDYEDPYMMWQASCTGNIDGISGDVDMDILYE